jgi:hypothetical protein
VDLAGVWADGPDDAFAVGGAPGDYFSTILHYDGTGWSPVNGVASGALGCVWGSGRNDVYATIAAERATGSPLLVHWDGSSWSPETVGPQSIASGIWGSGPTDLYVGGGWLEHGNGSGYWANQETALRYVNSGSVGLISSVAGSGAGDVFAAAGAYLVHARDGFWEQIGLPSAGTINGLSVTPSRVFIVGTMGEVHLDRPSVTCVGRETNCQDGWDNDCDGLVDAADPDCAGKVPERCANGIDDDGDGLIDCNDPDCTNFRTCSKR